MTFLFISAVAEAGGVVAPPVAPDVAFNIPHLARGTGRKALVESPLNIAVLVGQNVLLRCAVAEAPPRYKLRLRFVRM